MNRYSPLRAKAPTAGVWHRGPEPPLRQLCSGWPWIRSLDSYDVPFITYFLAVIFVAAGYGFRAATLTILLSALAAAYYFVAPEGSLALS